MPQDPGEVGTADLRGHAAEIERQGGLDGSRVWIGQGFRWSACADSFRRYAACGRCGGGRYEIKGGQKGNGGNACEGGSQENSEGLGRASVPKEAGIDIGQTKRTL